MASETGTAWRNYRAYLTSVADRFPIGAFALATSGWYFDSNDHKCPHDAWLEEFAVYEDRDSGDAKRRGVRVLIRLLGAFHDGSIELAYTAVSQYRLDGPAVANGHGDWLGDEFRLSPDGRLIHEIEWRMHSLRTVSRWHIEADDIEFRWIPK